MTFDEKDKWRKYSQPIKNMQQFLKNHQGIHKKMKEFFIFQNQTDFQKEFHTKRGDESNKNEKKFVSPLQIRVHNIKMQKNVKRSNEYMKKYAQYEKKVNTLLKSRRYRNADEIDARIEKEHEIITKEYELIVPDKNKNQEMKHKRKWNANLLKRKNFIYQIDEQEKEKRRKKRLKFLQNDGEHPSPEEKRKSIDLNDFEQSKVFEENDTFLNNYIHKKTEQLKKKIQEKKVSKNKKRKRKEDNTDYWGKIVEGSMRQSKKRKIKNQKTPKLIKNPIKKSQINSKKKKYVSKLSEIIDDLNKQEFKRGGVVRMSRRMWEKGKIQENIKDDVEYHGKDHYLEKVGFLNRTAIRESTRKRNLRNEHRKIMERKNKR